MTSPTHAILDNLSRLIGTPRDGALLRFSLGNEYLKAGDAAQAAEHLRDAVAKDPAYSAAWKLLGRALTESGDLSAALAAYQANGGRCPRKFLIRNEAPLLDAVDAHALDNINTPQEYEQARSIF